MDKKNIWPYYIWMYFDIVKDINKNYRRLIKLHGTENHRKIEKIYYEIMEEITQVIPYGYEKKKVKLKYGEGMLELIDNEFSFVEDILNNILKNIIMN